MARKKGKSVRFDTMVKFFIRNYDIPTKTDIDRLMKKLDRLEKLIKASGVSGKNSRISGGKKTRSRPASGKSTVTAADQVLAVIKKFQQGAGFKEIQERTGFDEKKIRNILYRLNKLKKIKRKGRGIYVTA